MAVLITRSEEEALELSQLLHEENIESIVWPVVSIEPVNRQIEPCPYDWVIYVSKTAIRLAVANYPQLTTAAAVVMGEGSRDTYQQCSGKTVMLTVPAPHNSETLLQQPQFAAEAVAGKRIAIVSGEGGRDLLQQQLQQRGATVDKYAIYRRILPQKPKQLTQQQWQSITTTVVTSVDLLHNLMQLVSNDQLLHLQQQQLLVISQRIATEAMQVGFNNVVVANGASNRAIATALCFPAK